MQQHYDEFRRFLQTTSGIELGDNKQYLVSSRLGRIMSSNGIADLSELVSRLRSDPRGALKQVVIDAMTTNETLWFRDVHPYNILRDRVLDELQKGRPGPVRIWSAACSSGQEPYSISISVEEYRQRNMGVLRNPVEIVATDLSRSMLDICRKAEYDSLALGRGLTNDRLRQYFDKTGPDNWTVKPGIRERVRFQPLNLLDNYTLLGKFDVVFCRNVLIYFSAELKADILRRIHGVLKPGGYLFLGASEGLSDVGKHFEMVQCSPGIIYRAL